MAKDTIFDGVAAFGRQLLGDAHSRQVLREYAWQLSSICDLIGHTHSIVISGLDRIEEAQTLEEAKELARELEEGPLEGSFRANGLCDVFEGLGRAVRRAVIPASEANPQEYRLVADNYDQGNAMVQFCDDLVHREQQVASVYADEIRKIADVA